MKVLLRLTSRSLRRLVRTNSLVVILIALSVGAGVYSAVVVRSDKVTAEDGYLQSVGTSEVRLEYGAYGSYANEYSVPIGDVAVEQALTADDLAPEWSEAISALEKAGGSVFEQQSGEFGAAYLESADNNFYLSDADLDQMIEHEVVLDVEGRAPTELGEVALSRHGAAEADLKVGDTTTSLSGTDVVVVGLVRHRPNADNRTVYMPAGSLFEREAQRFPSSLGVNGLTREQIVEAMASVGLTEGRLNEGFPPEGLPADETPQYTIATLEEAASRGFLYSSGEPGAVGALTSAALLIQAALISAVAFVVSIRRRTRDIGRLTAIGAAPTQLYRMFILEAAALGLVGAIAGCLLGLAAAYSQFYVIVPRLLGDASLRVKELEPQISDLAIPGGLAVVAAVLAMTIPAMWATALSPEKARNDGYGPVSVSSRLAMASGASFVFGCLALLVISRLTSAQGLTDSGWFMKEVLLVLSGLPILAGTAGLVYVAMQALHRYAGVLPLRLRFSSRDALRNPIRSIGAVTAFMALLMVVTAGMTASATQNYAYSEPGRDVSLTAGGVEEAVVSAIPGSVPIDLAKPEEGTRYRPTEIDPDLIVDGQRLRDEVLIDFDVSREEGSFISLGFESLSQLVVTSDVAAELDLSGEVKDALDDGSQLVLLVAEPESLPPASANIWNYESIEDQRRARLEIVQSDAFDGAPLLLVPEAFVEREGLATTDAQILYKNGGFTSDEIKKLYRYGYTSSGLGHGFEDPSDFEAELLVMIPVGLFILIVSRILSALSGVDSGADIATMISVGAPANFRRSQLAWQMAYCAAFAVVAAIPAGLIAGWVHTLGSWDYRFRFDVPLGVLVASLALPVVAWALIFFTTRRGQANVSHRLV